MNNMEEKKNQLSVVERLKLRAQEQKRAEVKVSEAKMDILICPHCGAGRAKADGLTTCAYCGHSFTNYTLTDGIHIKHSDNSR